jgi:hypothetical protein
MRLCESLLIIRLEDVMVFTFWSIQVYVFVRVLIAYVLYRPWLPYITKKTVHRTHPVRILCPRISYQNAFQTLGPDYTHIPSIGQSSESN